jgi:hypothetical protein
MEIAQTPFEQLVQFLPYLIPILLIELVLLVIALVDLVRREKTRYLPKWAWALLIIFIQIIGPIAYLIVGREE